MSTITVVTTKGFLNGARYVGRGQSIEVDEMRARVLEANGLITRNTSGPAYKVVSKPKNKMDISPANKAGAKGKADASDQ